MWTAPLALLLALQAPQTTAQAPTSAPYPVFETDFIAPSEHKERRERLMKEMVPGSAAIFFTNPTRNRNNDVDFQFRADSNFLYLTGFTEPDAALILAPGGFEVDGKKVKEAIFVPESNEMSLTWLGYRMGSKNAVPMLGIEAALPNERFEAALSGLKEAKSLSIQLPPDPSGDMLKWAEAAKKFRTDNKIADGANLRGAVRTMRGIKSPAEIAMIRKAAEISAKGHVEVMRSIEPGMREWEISALVSYMFRRDGCEYEGYPNICGAGMNSTILHYNTNRAPIKSGDVMCMDTAGEYHGYTADVTRSFPATGKWSKEQRAIYDAVLRAQTLGISLCKPGATMRGIGDAINQDIGKSLIALGIIKDQSEVRRYYMHSFGHGIGLDVHDPVPSTLAAGAVLTVEPGIYIKPGSPCDKKWWNIGIRIEDDIVVAAGEPINLSIGAPRDPDAIERLMKDKGIGNIGYKSIK